MSSGNKAANIAHQSFEPFEHWKPGLSTSAGKAALVAHRDGGRLDLWHPSASDTGHTAAGAAMGKQRGPSPRVDYGYTDDGHKKALLAAKLSVSGRNRSDSSPAPSLPSYPDAHNAGHNALNAASVAHKPTVRSSAPSSAISSEANEAARLTHLNPPINRDLYSSHPPVNVPSSPNKHDHALRGASLATAKSSASTTSQRSQPRMDAAAYARADIQSQAQKLAHERLAKLDPDGVQAYRDHYFNPQPNRSRLSVLSRRSKSLNEGSRRRKKHDDDSDDDAKRAGRIRHQTSRLNEQVASVDAAKRKTDRDTLMAAAEKSVRQRMSDMDRQVYDETGKVTPAMMEDWDRKARERAAKESEKRMEHHGLVDIGGGKFMDQSEVEKIASERMAPTLEEIGTQAEKARARDEEVRLDNERRKEEAATEKQREREVKGELKKLRHEKKQTDKAEAKAKKEGRKSGEEDKVTAKPVAGGHATASGLPAPEPSPKKHRFPRLTKAEKAASQPSTEDPPGVPTTFDAKVHSDLAHNDTDQRGARKGSMDKSSISKPSVEKSSVSKPSVEEPSAPNDVQFKRNPKRDSRVRSWLAKLKGGHGKHGRAGSVDSGTMGTASTITEEEPKDRRHSYNPVRKASKEETVSESTPVKEQETVPEVSATGDVTMESKDKQRARSISPPSPSPSPPSSPSKRYPTTTSDIDDEFEEAKDKFDDDALKAPGELRVTGTRVSMEGSPSRSGSRFHEEL